jgi:acetoin utilization deacetylase AcuC-like enzyme
MANRTAFYHDEKCLWHTAGEHALVMPVGGWVQPVASGGHAESPESKRRFVSLLAVSGLGAEVDVFSAPMADEADLARVHPMEYLKAFKAASDSGGGDLGDYAPFGRGSYEIARLSAGLGVRAVNDVVSGRCRNAYAMTRPPGHHCLPHRPMGFCLLANIAVAVEAAIARHSVERVLILDWDVHHGNGTQAAFEERADVYTISIHQDRCFPPGYSGFEERGKGAGTGYNLNIPLLPGGGHDAYLYAYERLVAPAIAQFAPDLIVVASGLDANAADPLARMQATSATFAELTGRLFRGRRSVLRPCHRGDAGGREHAGRRPVPADLRGAAAQSTVRLVSARADRRDGRDAGVLTPPPQPAARDTATATSLRRKAGMVQGGS